MIHDGSSRNSNDTGLDEEEQEVDSDENKMTLKRSTASQLDFRHTKKLLRGVIWWFNIHRLNVSLINRIEFRDSKVFTMIVESFTTTSRLKLAMTTKFVDEIKSVKDSLNKSRNIGVPDSTLSKLDHKKLAEAFDDEDLSESYFLAIHGVSKLLNADADLEAFLPSAFVLHSVILRHVALSERRLPLVTFDDEFEQQINAFLAKISDVFRAAIENPEWNKLMEVEEVETDAIDLVDGRLFRVVIQAMSDDSFNGIIPAELEEDWESISRIVNFLTKQDLSIKAGDEVESSKTSAKEDDFKEKSEDLSVLPFTNAVFDKHLACIHVNTDSSLHAKMGAMKLYRETTHWHNHKKPLNPKYAPAAKVSKWKNPLRTNQFYMNEMTTYAASLTGAKGKALDAETITVGPKKLIKLVEEEPEKPEKSSSKSKKEALQDAKSEKANVNAKKGTKKAAAGLSKKDQMIADNKERKGGNESDKAFNVWSTKMKDFETISDDQDRYLKTIEYLNGLDSTKTGYLEAEINTFILQSLLTWWYTYCKADTKPEGYHVVALIWTTIRSICTSKAPVSKEIVQHMTKICTMLGIEDALTGFKPSAPIDRKLSFVFKYPASVSKLPIGISQTDFQLNYCGPYMDRMLDAKPDARVSSFVPDGWQRDVLDQLDANRSVFVVAPTSAGKTFISFYAMEQVLRADNDGVLVYVAPTKALVNQIAAEVQGKISITSFIVSQSNIV